MGSERTSDNMLNDLVVDKTCGVADSNGPIATRFGNLIAQCCFKLVNTGSTASFQDQGSNCQWAFVWLQIVIRSSRQIAARLVCRQIEAGMHNVGRSETKNYR